MTRPPLAGFHLPGDRNSNNPLIINAARAEIARCVASRKLETGELKKTHKLPGGETVWDLIVKGHGDLRRLRAGHTKLPNPDSVNAFLAEHAPPVLDPFCGGGSIPLEAQRLGLRAYGSDLNPVPVLITKALIEIPPKFAGKPPVNPKSDKKMAWHGAEGLAEDVRYYGKWMRDEAENRIGHLYPKVTITKEMTKDRPDLKPCIGEELTVIAWLWARTIRCPNPACGIRMPLLRSFWLSTKEGKRAWLEPIATRDTGVRFTIHNQGSGPKEAAKTARGAHFRCLVCNAPANEEYIKAEGAKGDLDQQMTAIVAAAGSSRIYLPAQESHIAASNSGTPRWAPDTDLSTHPQYMGVVYYGLKKNRDLHTQRQLCLLSTLSDLLADVKQHIEKHMQVPDRKPDPDYVGSVLTYLGLGISKLTAFHCALGIWRATDNKTGRAFGRHALPMVWDFPEANPFADAGGELTGTFDAMAGLLARLYRLQDAKLLGRQSLRSLFCMA